MNGTLIGVSKDELDRKKQTIIDFSELGEFIHEPIKTYSSGMMSDYRDKNAHLPIGKSG
jgi:lipopolysaccharide transport system ATP-binding protein